MLVIKVSDVNAEITSLIITDIFMCRSCAKIIVSHNLLISLQIFVSFSRNIEHDVM
jgi:hypothetical protein